MKLRRRGFPLRSISEKDEGQVEWIAGMFFLLMLMVVMHTRLQLDSWSSTAVYLEDALAASNLASALIDVEEYGKTHKVCLSDEQKAFEIYQEAVKANLGLDEQWNCVNEGMITGPVEIVNYIIYNVDGQLVEVIRLNGNGELVERRKDILGSVAAPDGSVVEYTGVYSEISFSVKGFPGLLVEAHKGKLVDIVSEEIGGVKDERG